MEMILDGDTNTTGFSARSCLADPPESASGSGIVFCRGASRSRLYFGGVGAGGTVNYRIILWYKVRNKDVDTNDGIAYWPEVQALGVFTLGTKTYGSGGTGLGASGNLIADTVTETMSKSGTIVFSPGDNTQGYVDVSLDNSMFMEIQTDIAATATSVDVLVQLG